MDRRGENDEMSPGCRGRPPGEGRTRWATGLGPLSLFWLYARARPPSLLPATLRDISLPEERVP